jgi:ketosteroid isomerase-like protein
MYRPMQVLTVVALLLTAGCVQTRPSVLTEAELEQLRQTIQELRQAIIESDIAALERIYADDYVLTNRRGIVRTKSERIELIRSGELRYLDLGAEDDVNLRLYGSVAVVTGRSSTNVVEVDGEERRSGVRRFTAVWVYEGGAWRQVARQHTAIASETAGSEGSG